MWLNIDKISMTHEYEYWWKKLMGVQIVVNFFKSMRLKQKKQRGESDSSKLELCSEYSL